MFFLKRIKRFFLFLFFLAFLVVALVSYSLYEEESYKKSCREFGLECSRGSMHSTVEKAEAWFSGWMHKFKLDEIWKKISGDSD